MATIKQIPPHEEIERQVDLASTLLANDSKVSEAYTILANAVKKEPLHPVALLLKAQACSILPGKATEMNDDISTVTKQFPDWMKTDTTMKGYLKKVMKAVTKKYFFCLKGRFIVWYNNEKDTLIEKGIYLHSFKVEKDSKKGRFDIEITNIGLFSLEGENDISEVWINRLADISNLPKISNYVFEGKEKTTYADNLYKAGGKATGTQYKFKKRYCVLKGNVFYYYVQPNDLTPKGQWDLRESGLARIKEHEDATNFRWKVTLKEDQGKKEEDRTLYVESKEKREKWLIVMVEVNKTIFKIVEKKGKEGHSHAPSSSGLGGGASAAPPRITSPSPMSKPSKIAQSKRDSPVRRVSLLEDGIREEQPMSSTNVLLPSSDVGGVDKNAISEITELVSPRPMTCCFFNSKFYETIDVEKERNSEAIKSGRVVGFDEEWEEDGKELMSGDEDEEDEQCLIS